MEVPRVRTPLSELELGRVLREGHRLGLSEEPDPERLGVGWSQCMLEHARGSAVYCNNVGNVTASPTWSGDWYRYPFLIKERVSRNPDKWRELDLRFRAHRTPVEGAADYWRLLARRFASSLALFDDGDPRQAAHVLSVTGYYTALEGPYGTAMVQLYAFFWRSIAPRLGVQPEVPFTAEEALALVTTLEQTKRRIDDALAGEASQWRFRPPAP